LDYLYVGEVLPVQENGMLYNTNYNSGQRVLIRSTVSSVRVGMLLFRVEKILTTRGLKKLLKKLYYPWK
jgi:hypothetical protein